MLPLVNSGSVKSILPGKQTGAGSVTKTIGLGLITTLKVAFKAHCPNVGVKVLEKVPATDVFKFGDQDPIIAGTLFEKVGRAGAKTPWHKGAGVSKRGEISGFTVIFNVVITAQTPAIDVGVNVYVAVPTSAVLTAGDQVPTIAGKFVELVFNTGAVLF